MIRATFVTVLCGALLYFAWSTRHWQMLVNAPVMHYVNFLMSHGMRPYREITDMNMPGAYLLERFGMDVFGAGDAGWRVYDFFLAAVLIWAMVVIAKPYDWMAGLFAGGLFALRHGSEGAWFAGEREQEMAVLLVVACALLFVGVRRRQPFLTAGFGFMAGMAASIKPTLAPFGVCGLVVLYFELRRRMEEPARYLLWGVAGLLLAAGISVLFLWHYHAFSSFAFVVQLVTPLYSATNDPGRRFLVRHIAPDEWLLFVPLAIAGHLGRKRWTWEHSILVLGVACGLLSYFFQRKGFFYQRYTYLAFLLLLCGMLILPAGRKIWAPWLAAGALLYATFYVVPVYLHALRKLPEPSALTAAMEADLGKLSAQTDLQRGVQCFDMTFGCLNSLYHLGLVENTGFTGDLLLFPHEPNPASQYYRGLFWEAQKEHAARVIVATNQEFGAPNSFRRFSRWPELTSDLAANYILVATRSFPYEDKFRGEPPAPPETAPTYRIYLRKGEKIRSPGTDKREARPTGEGA